MKRLNGIKVTDGNELDNLNMDMLSKLFEQTTITTEGNGNIDLKHINIDNMNSGLILNREDDANA